MKDKKSIGKKMWYEDEILRSFIVDPTKSIQDIATKLSTYRQRVWRKKKKYEDEHVIWGYTAVIDESKFGHVMYLVLMKIKPMSDALAQLITERITMGDPYKQNVRLINVLYVNGQYDMIVMFTAPDHATARRYYDSLRIAYEEFLVAKPTIVDVNFSLIREGKKNPEIIDLFEFIPIKDHK